MRLFIALPIPDEVARACGLLAGRLPSDALRPVRPELMHLTLAFLGEAEEPVATAASAALDEAARGLSPFAARLGAVGVFPDPRRPRVVWVGLDVGAAEVERTANAVRGALSRRGVAFDPKPAVAHITIGHARDRASPADRRALGRAIAGLGPSEAVAFEIAEAQLVHSTLGRGGPTYVTLRRVGLG